MKNIKLLLTFILLFTLSTKNVLSRSETINIPISEDTYTEEYFPYVSPWNNKNFYIGLDRYYNKGKTYTYIKFPNDTLNNSEILAQDIIEANLKIFQYDYEGSTDYTLQAWTTKRLWSQYDINWNNQPNPKTLISEQAASSINGWKSINISSLIKDTLIEGKDGAVLVKMKDENNRAAIFWSTACRFAPTPPSCDEGQQPHVTVKYIPNTPPSPPILKNPPDNLMTNQTSQHFRALRAKDSNGEELKYGLQISTTEDFTDKLYEANLQLIPFFNYNFNKQGQFFWRVFAQDTHGPKTGRTYSVTRAIVIDTESPSSPLIFPEPPFNAGTTNKICWNKSSDNLSPNPSYQAEIASDNFKTIEEKSAWLEDTCHNFTNLRDGTKYYYRMRAKDTAGNLSKYSSIVSSTQDNTPPNIKTFKISEKYISPNNSSSIDVKDSTQIKARIRDTSLQKWSVIITDTTHNELNTYKFTSKKTEYIQWPPTSKRKQIKEGKYFIFIKATDKLGRHSHSRSLILEVDNTSPKPPRIIAPAKNIFTNKFPSLKFQFDNKTINTTKINGKMITKYNRDSGFKQEILKQGSNRIVAFSEDWAGNKSSATREFVYDTIKPKPPKISIDPDMYKHDLYLNISGEKFATAQIFINGSVSKQIKLGSNNVRILIVKDWIPEKSYSVFVKLVDRAGNLSKPSQHEEYTTPASDIFGIGSIDDEDIDFAQPPKIHTCTIEVNSDTDSYKIGNCTPPSPKLAHLLNYGKIGTNYWLETYGTIQKRLKLKIKHKRCKKTTIIDPRTWFRCVEQIHRISTKTVRPRNYISSIVNGNELTTYKQAVDSHSHFHTTNYTRHNTQAKKLSVRNTGIKQLRIDNVWIDLNVTSKNSDLVKIPKPISPSHKGFIFFFNKMVGVTQWHGHTAYQSPHTGIDFGSYREPILAPADGVIKVAKWDDYLGACNSGGYYMRIEHENGMNTVYLHLENFKNTNGHSWKKGEKIKQGQQIGISGNSGAWNCQSLGYHLHFELRKDRYQINHVNPVPYIDVDWDKIPTLNWQTYPGRLSGDNPHPSF